MTNIEKLIERLRAKRRDMTCDHYDAILGEAADALTRLVAPLSAEVKDSAGVIGHETPCDYGDCHRCDAARLLESLALENARLAEQIEQEKSDHKGDTTSMLDNVFTLAQRCEALTVLRDEMEVAKAALLELSQLGGGRSEGNWIAQRALAKLDAMKGGAT